MAKGLGVHKSTAQRLALTLEKAGFLRHCPASGTYTLGLKLLELGTAVLNGVELRREARPYLERLQRDTGCTIHLGILDAVEVVYVDELEGSNPIRIYSQIGRRAPVHCTGLGKALLAYQPVSAIRRLAAQRGLKCYTSETITSVEDLLAELECVRQCGFATEMAEYEPLVYCVAAPIRDNRGTVVAAISRTMVAASLSPAEARRRADPVVAAAAAMSASLGWRVGSGKVGEPVP
jgi:DNA-binding IclR family transcriptional regulator